jgi:hypothetical protein
VLPRLLRVVVVLEIEDRDVRSFLGERDGDGTRAKQRDAEETACWYLRIGRHRSRAAALSGFKKRSVPNPSSESASAISKWPRATAIPIAEVAHTAAAVAVP